MVQTKNELMSQQSTSNLLMIRPVSFGFNEQTAGSNAFQNRNAKQQQVQDNALNEFDNLVSLLQDNGVEVIVVREGERCMLTYFDTRLPLAPGSVTESLERLNGTPGDAASFDALDALLKQERKEGQAHEVRNRNHR